MNIEDFQDINPLPQEDGPEPVCSITYSPEFTEAFDYLRAILKSDERSQRAFDLTTVCLKLNPANYTVWHFRRRCLMALSNNDNSNGDSSSSSSIDVEKIKNDLEFADKLGGTNPKNYQLWYHRRALLEFRFKGQVSTCTPVGEVDETLKVAQKELDYVDKILDDDSKNYHAWSHRQWTIRTLNNPQLWSAEIDYAHTKILSDPRNNSAWNQRWFALHNGVVNVSTKGAIISLEKAKEEASYALSGANVDPFNESPWRYLIGMLMEQWRSAQRGGTAEDIEKISDLISDCITNIEYMKKTLEAKQKVSPDKVPSGSCVSLLSALVDLLEIFKDRKDFLLEASRYCGELIEEDPVRRKYWRKREKEILKVIDMSPAQSASEQRARSQSIHGCDGSESSKEDANTPQHDEAKSPQRTRAASLHQA